VHLDLLITRRRRRRRRRRRKMYCDGITEGTGWDIWSLSMAVLEGGCGWGDSGGEIGRGMF
jgi:hypothetical protein